MITPIGITRSDAANATRPIVPCASSTAESNPINLAYARSEGDRLWDKAFAETPTEVYASIIADIRASIESDGTSDLSFMDE